RLLAELGFVLGMKETLALQITRRRQDVAQQPAVVGRGLLLAVDILERAILGLKGEAFGERQAPHANLDVLAPLRDRDARDLRDAREDALPQIHFSSPPPGRSAAD